MLEEFLGILRARRLETVFQPIRESQTTARVGYEALVRGPSGSVLSSAASLLGQAYRTDRVIEFDWAARAAACRAAMDAGLDPGYLLFLNVEPLALGSTCPPDLLADIDEAFGRYQVILEVTERSLERDPASLLEGIQRQRGSVAGFAIDDLGAHAASLAMLPALAPDVIKLDLTITQAGPSPAIMHILDSAQEEAERTGATILAEGVETAADLAFATAAGAQLVQGNYLGEPGPLPRGRTWSAPGWRLGERSPSSAPTPFDALTDHPTSRAGEDLLGPLSRHVAFRGVRYTEPAIVLVLVPDRARLTPADRRRLSDLSRRGVMAAALGPGLPTPPAPGVRGGNPVDPSLAGQWAVVALGPGAASAMLARQATDDSYDFAVTHDRGRVIAAATSVLRRLGPT